MSPFTNKLWRIETGIFCGCGRAATDVSKKSNPFKRWKESHKQIEWTFVWHGMGNLTLYTSNNNNYIHCTNLAS
jgi:hypothetical protein